MVFLVKAVRKKQKQIKNIFLEMFLEMSTKMQLKKILNFVKVPPLVKIAKQQLGLLAAIAIYALDAVAIQVELSGKVLRTLEIM